MFQIMRFCNLFTAKRPPYRCDSSEKARNSTQLVLTFNDYLTFLDICFLISRKIARRPKRPLKIICISSNWVENISFFFSIRALAKKLDFFRKFSKSWKNLEKNLRFFLLKIILKINNCRFFEISKFSKFLIFHMIFNIKNLRFFSRFFQDFEIFEKIELSKIKKFSTFFDDFFFKVV